MCHLIAYSFYVGYELVGLMWPILAHKTRQYQHDIGRIKSQLRSCCRT